MTKQCLRCKKPLPLEDPKRDVCKECIQEIIHTKLNNKEVIQNG